MKRTALLALAASVLIGVAIGGLLAVEAVRTSVPKRAASPAVPKSVSAAKSAAAAKPAADAWKSAPQTPSEVRYHYGMCDASGAISVGAGLFVVCNNEDNRLRMYRRDEGALPVYGLETAGFLGNKKDEEANLEAAARLGNRLYWIGSHGTNKNGKYRKQRHRLFATDIEFTSRGIELACVGRPYKELVRDMAADPRLAKYKLAEAATRMAKTFGALDIEGLAGRADGALLIGLRNPIPNGKALIVPLLNPQGVISGESGRFGEPIELDLDARGVRSIEYWQDRGYYLIIAGSYDRTPRFDLYRWPGKGPATRIPGIAFAAWNPEALVIYQDQPDRIQVLSDDGECKIDGIPCKKLPDENQRRFRSGWLEIK